MINPNISILIPDGESPYAIAALRCLSEVQGVKINLLSDDLWAMVRFSRHRDKFCAYRFGTDEEKISAIVDAVEKTESDIVLPVGASTIRLISANRERFSSLAALPLLPSPEMMDLAMDKGRLTKFLVENNIPSPETIFCANEDLSRQNLSRITFPVLVKPVISEGGRGIVMCGDISELFRFLDTTGSHEDYIIQSFIKGYDMGCSVLCENGEILAYTMQKGIIPPYHEFAPPAGVEFFQDEHVYDVVRELIRRLNWSGVANIDMRYDEWENKTRVLEINPRYWSSLIGSLVAGINFPYLACLKSLGRDLPQNDYRLNRYIHHKAAIKLMLKNLIPGKRSSIKIRGTGIEYVMKDPLPNVVKFFKDLLLGKLDV